MKKLLLVDGNSLVFRAYHATSYGTRMTTKNGIPTNAVFGFAMMMQKALDTIRPDAVLVAFDTGKKTFRHAIYEAYKGTRKPVDDDLKVQFPIVREYLDAMQIRRYEREGIEADDIIGSMVKQNPDWDINILSSDRDLLQLIDATSSVWLMKKGLSEIEEMTEASLMEAYHLTPSQIIDLKGLSGDVSDNIPGIPKVGEKTATKWLLEYGTVENVLEHVDELKGKIKDTVKQYADQARLSKQLATINVYCNIPIDPKDCTQVTDVKKAYQFYMKYDMHSFAAKLEQAVNEEQKELAYRVIEQLPNGYFDETTALVVDACPSSVNEEQVYGMAFYNTKGCYYVRLENAQADEAIAAWLIGAQEIIVVNSKHVFHALRPLFPPFNGHLFDVQIASFLACQTDEDMAGLYQTHGQTMRYRIEDVYGKPNKPIVPDAHIQEVHACEQASAIYHIYGIVKRRLKQLDMEALFYEIEMPLAHILFEMEVEGIRVDESVLDRIAAATYEQMTSLSEQIYALAGETFNINSPKKLSEILYDKLQLPCGKKRSTAVDVLAKLVHAHPIVAKIMEYRKYQKLYSTYAEGLKKYIHADGKIHTQYHQCITQTGRLSSTEPNLQNISIRTEEGREVRKAFIPEPGCVLMSADYSQVELRMLAHMAKEEGLIQAFRDQMDVHTKTAMDVFHVAKEDVTPLMRRKAKAVNFGVVYGISDFGLSEQLQIPRKEAQQYIDGYFASYPRIKQFMDDVVKQCERDGYVSTLCKRRREIPEIHDKNYMVREFGKRAAMNAPIQGSAADLIKLAMIHIDKRMKEEHLTSKMILQVHDELIFNVPEAEREIMKRVIEEEMEHAMSLDVPLEAQCVEGKTWYEAK